MSSGQRPRSPSPSYRTRRYSPSRAVSPPPPLSSTLPQPPARRHEPASHHRRDDMAARPMRSEHYSPPPSARPPISTRDAPQSTGDRYGQSSASGMRSRSPSPRYRNRRSRSPQRYHDSRPYSPPPQDRYRSSPPAPVGGRRNRPGAADFYDDAPREKETFERRRPEGSMIADREEERAREIPPPRLPKVQDQWERGVEPPREQVSLNVYYQTCFG